MFEVLQEIWVSLSRNKLRTFLTGFSVAWGIFILIVLLGASKALQQGVEANFGHMMKNVALLQGNRTSLPFQGYDKGRSIRLDQRDIDALSTRFETVKEVALSDAYFFNTDISHENTTLRGRVTGVSSNYAAFMGIKVQQGRFINASDIQQRRKVVVLDSVGASLLFKNGSAIDQWITIQQGQYRVVGVQQGNRYGRTQVYLPLSTGTALFRTQQSMNVQIVCLLDGVNTDKDSKQLEKQIRKTIANIHTFDPNDRMAIRYHNPMEEFKKIRSVFMGITLFMWVVGLGTLMAGIVGVSNIMLVTVRERTSEFGIRKALGAKPSSILWSILCESLLITVGFGYLGLLAGMLVMEVANDLLAHQAQTNELFTIFKDPTVDLHIALGAIATLVVAGVVAGYVPARRATALKTIDALRYNKN